MTYRAAIICLAVLTVGGARNSSAVEILVPGEHISSSRSSISIVGYATVPILHLYVNGAFRGELAVQDSIFHAKVRLPYGLNEILITHTGSEASSNDPDNDSISVLCGPRFSRDQIRFFDEYRFHDRERPAACRRCHVQNEGAQPAGMGEWCYPCHNDVRQRLREHIVDDTRPCTGCHLIERDLQTTIQTGIDNNPCYQCHTDKIGLLARDYVHGPVAGGSCTVCHDPHGSQFAKTLVSPVPILCQACHLSVSGQTLPVQHYPFAQGWCVDCHDPHATSNKWVLLKEGQELCLGCHFTDATRKTHRHPYGVKPRNKKLASQLQLGKDGKLDCLTCHTPHASTASFLLRTDEENKCLGCHLERT
jgi:predicted CXXCH cytochrome family protein